MLVLGVGVIGLGAPVKLDKDTTRAIARRMFEVLEQRFPGYTYVILGELATGHVANYVFSEAWRRGYRYTIGVVRCSRMPSQPYSVMRIIDTQFRPVVAMRTYADVLFCLGNDPLLDMHCDKFMELKRPEAVIRLPLEPKASTDASAVNL